MDEPQRQACLGELLANWKALGEEFRPPSVWIAEHGPVTLAKSARRLSGYPDGSRV